MARARIYIGTSGWHYKHWLGTFYPAGTNAKQQFNYYTKYFDTVEINNSFYKLPPREVFEGWYQNSPRKFLFVIKANRFITHNLKLTRPLEPLTRLFNSIAPLKEKLGPILFQLPPKWKVNVERLKAFLQALPVGYSYVFEFRNDTWYNEEVYTLLQEYNCAFCIYELGGHLSPLKVTADFVYVRLHGPSANKYQDSYNRASLNKWAKLCMEWQSQKKKVYVYFDNDQHGYAAFNAISLKAMVKKLTAMKKLRSTG
ncbi:DUF72 domain-containing protein [Longitalea arenae]|uniref:DUF72 domain-containing protein n=1 Tax=Longitalea arenae TaxID=2812558 RepID=UPI001967DC78|nr:DUF72 domain-containing protein [Longitalea arenae]